MTRAAPFLLLLGLAIPLAARDARAEQLAFQLYAMGFPVAESSMVFNLAPASYHMELRYHTTGLGKLVSGDRLDQSSNGMFEHDEAVPTEFRSFVRLHAQDRIVTLEYRNGDPTIATINPPNEAEREIVPPVRRDHTIDPLSAMIDMLHVAARTGRCDLSHNTYDGRRLEVFEARTAGEEDIPASSRSIFSGRALRCDYTSQPIAGLKLGDGRDEDARVRKGTVWLAPLAPGGPRLPVQGVVDVRFLGTATSYLTAVTP
jgi:hypothetical protein